MKGLLCWYLAKISNPCGGLTWMFGLVMLTENDMCPASYRSILIGVSLVLSYLAAKFVATNYEEYFISIYSWFSSRINFLQTKTGYVVKTFLSSFFNSVTVFGFIIYCYFHS